MGDECPGDSINARIALQVPARELGELAIITQGQVLTDLAQLLIHDVEVIYQPFSSRRDGKFFADRLGDHAITVEQNPAVFPDTPREEAPFALVGGDMLRRGRAFGVLFESFDAEEFCADQLLEFSENNDGGMAVLQRKSLGVSPAFCGLCCCAFTAKTRRLYDYSSRYSGAVV